MVKYIGIIVIALLFITCKTKKSTGEPLPSFSILLKDSTTMYDMGSVEKGAPIVLLYFSPDCEHCQKETEDIIHHMNLLKSYRFYFVTNDDFTRLKTFNNYYKLDKYPNIIVGRDERFFLLRHFKGAYPPYIVLYDEEKRQKAAFQGGISIDTMITSLNKL